MIQYYQPKHGGMNIVTISIYFDQIPEDEGIDTQDYPEYTSFILDDSHPKRDPVTFQLIPPPKRTKIYPSDIVKVQRGDVIPMHRFVSLLHNGNKLLCPLCCKGRISTPYDPKTSHHFYCDGCGADLRID